MIAAGLMSGTSLDGIDAALVRILPRGGSYRVDLLNFATLGFDADLREALMLALPPHGGTIAQAAALHRRLGQAFARAALHVAGDMPLDYVASHGQTLYHDGDAHVTVQAGDAFVMREALGSTVCYDFRSADCAAGGHGAPLVPYVDALLLGDAREDRVAVNIGGIANLTILPRGAAPGDVFAFDCGPGNMLIDAFVSGRTGGAQAFDEGGVLGLRGSPDEKALQAMAADPYFALGPPKSTGREYFGAQFLQQHGDSLRALSLEDGAATLAALTARTVADAVSRYAAYGSRVLVSGGGAHNAGIMQGLARRLPGSIIAHSDAHGLHGDAKEAIAFAVLGYELLRERPSGLPRVTGASHAAVLGAIAPHDLLELLAKVQTECRT